MEPRLKNPAASHPEVMQAMMALTAASQKGNVPVKTLKMVHLRASQINGCSYCVDMHSRELKEAGETDQRIFAVAAWHDAPFFTDAERAALALTEAATRLSDRADAVPDAIWEEAARHYDEAALVSLVVNIGIINFWNRITVTTRQIPARAINKPTTPRPFTQDTFLSLPALTKGSLRRHGNSAPRQNWHAASQGHSLTPAAPQAHHHYQNQPTALPAAQKLPVRSYATRQRNSDVAKECFMVAPSASRVSLNTEPSINDRIRRQTEVSIAYYSRRPDEIGARLRELDEEWDVERALETGSSALTLTGITFALFGSRKWLLLSLVVQGFFMQHSIQGWCPPLPALRRLGFRTQTEIEKERRVLEDILLQRQSQGVSTGSGEPRSTTPEGRTRTENRMRDEVHLGEQSPASDSTESTSQQSDSMNPSGPDSTSSLED